MRLASAPPRRPWRSIAHPFALLVSVVLMFVGAVLGLNFALGPPAPTAMVAALPPAGVSRQVEMRQIRERAADLGVTTLVFVGPLDPQPTMPPTAPVVTSLPAAPPAPVKTSVASPTKPAAPPAKTSKAAHAGPAPVRKTADTGVVPTPAGTDGPAPGLRDYLIVDPPGGVTGAVDALAPEFRVVDRTGTELRPGHPATPRTGAVLGWALVLLMIGLLLEPREYWRRTAAVLATNDPPPGPDAVAVPAPVAQRPKADEPVTGRQLELLPAQRRSGLDILASYTKPVPAGAGPQRQCPNCGSFRIVRADSQQHRCSDCSHAWRLEPGRAWPTVVVRPRRQHRS